MKDHHVGTSLIIVSFIFTCGVSTYGTYMHVNSIRQSGKQTTVNSQVPE